MPSSPHPTAKTPPTQRGAAELAASAESSLRIAVANEQAALAIDESLLIRGVRAVLADAERAAAEISLAVVDDAAIHRLNRQYLDHDYPTDVLSFSLGDSERLLEGEIVVSAETAAREAYAYGWPAEHELLLYVVHGALHLVGHDDRTAAQAARMRDAERRVLARFGIVPPDSQQEESPCP